MKKKIEFRTQKGNVDYIMIPECWVKHCMSELKNVGYEILNESKGK